MDILSEMAGFHIKHQEETLEKDMGNWGVSVIELPRTERHQRAALSIFWERLDL